MENNQKREKEKVFGVGGRLKKNTQDDTRQTARWWWGCTSTSPLFIADLHAGSTGHLHYAFPWTEVAFFRQAACAHVAAKRRGAPNLLPTHYNNYCLCATRFLSSS